MGGGAPLTKKRAIVTGVLFFICVWLIHDAVISNIPQPFIYFQF
jgi:hypothetical protein